MQLSAFTTFEQYFPQQEGVEEIFFKVSILLWLIIGDVGLFSKVFEICMQIV